MIKQIRIRSQCNEMGQELPPEITIEATVGEDKSEWKLPGEFFRTLMDAATKPKEPRA